MKTMKILVPTDFSEQATFALDFSAELAHLFKAQIHLIHIVEYAPGSTADITGINPVEHFDSRYLMQLLDGAKGRMEEISAKARYSNIEMTYDVSVGNAFTGITNTITEMEVDLIVMGSKGSSGLAALFIGSNTEKVVRNAACPVVTIKNHTSVHDIKEILFATDLEDYAEKAIHQLKVLQEKLGAHLHLLKINTIKDTAVDAAFLHRLKLLANQCGLTNYSVHVIYDKVEELGIKDFATQNDIDMIALVTHGRSGFLQLLSASVAEDLVNHASKPVWTYLLND